MARLIFLQSERFAGRVCELVCEITRVGRDPHNALVIDDKSVSADHCEILVYGTEVIVRDRGSTNGCFVDGVRVVGQRPVRDGQVIRWGSIEARLELSPEDEFDTEGATSNTAVHLQQQWLHAESHPKPQTPPPIAASPVDTVPRGETAQVRRVAEVAPPPSAGDGPGESQGQSRRWFWHLWALGLGLGLLAFLLAAVVFRWLR